MWKILIIVFSISLSKESRLYLLTFRSISNINYLFHHTRGFDQSQLYNYVQLKNGQSFKTLSTQSIFIIN